MAGTGDDIIIDETEDPKPLGLGANDVDETLPDDKVLPRGAELNADGSVTVTLDYPKKLQIRGGNGQTRDERFDRLTFHRLNGADINALTATAPEHHQVVLFTRSLRLRSAIVQALYAKMDGADIARCGKVLNTFL